MFVESVEADDVKAEANVAVNTDIITIPTNIQMSPNALAGIDLGARSP